MKRILLSILLFALSVGANAQFSPNTVLTAAALNAALAAPTITGGMINGTVPITTGGNVTLTGTNSLGSLTSATTQSYIDSTTHVATNAFVGRSILAATATLPINVAGASGTYNFATSGSGAIFGVTTSSGAIASITGIVAGGIGYQVGDCLVFIGGNGDAIAYVSTVSSGAVTTATVLYGGTGYSGTPQLTVSGLPPGSRTGAITGVLTGNVTIVVPSGTFLAGGRRFGFTNNTTGPYSITVKLSNGAGGSTGTGLVLPQGTNNSTSMLVYTDGVNDVWPEISAVPNLIIPGTLTVAGVNMKPNLSGTTGSLGGSGLGSGACSSVVVAIAGATVAMAVAVSPAIFPGTGFYWQGYVSSAGNVTVEICSAQSGTNTPTASVYNVRVMQ